MDHDNEAGGGEAESQQCWEDEREFAGISIPPLLALSLSIWGPLQALPTAFINWF